MHLWSDYEGKTIAGAYPLGQLIRPEGRSAFFATSNGTGVPAVIRLTESLNDEAEMIERWRQIVEMKQEHLVTIRKFGQTKFESTPLAYALMEPSDGNLAEILKERPLTPTETREVALSLVDALTALHANGLVHAAIEPSNVMAVGDVIKLRSDCVRECRLDFEFLTAEECDALRRHDVEMLGTLLLQALTLEKQPAPSLFLPAPFDRIIARGLDGTWGLKEIEAALNPPAIKPLVPPGVISGGVRPVAAQGGTDAVATPAVTPSMAAAVPVPAVPEASAESMLDVTAASAAAGPVPSMRAPLVPPGTLSPKGSGPSLNVRRVASEVTPERPSNTIWIACAAALIILALIGWRALSGKPSAKAVPVSAVAPAATVAPAPVVVVPPPAAVPRAAAPMSRAPVTSASSAHAPVATSASQAGWHVIAFTYNHEEQAFGKVASIRSKHPSLSPEVFSPNGRAPYLVALGGGMSEREANSMKSRALRDGMPRDTFARRYGAR